MLASHLSRAISDRTRCARICPGRHFAETALLFNLASVIHVFQITPPLDEEGRPIKIIPRATDGLLS